MSNSKKHNTRRPSSQFLKLEQRLMFDGAVVDTTLDTFMPDSPDMVDVQQDVSGQELFATAVAYGESEKATADAEAQVKAFLQNTTAEELFTLFNGGAEEPTQEWLDTANALIESILNDEFSLQVEWVGNDVLGFAKGAFAQAGLNGEPTVYLNADMAQSLLEAPELTSVLVEELGHAIDFYLNGANDTEGDEGHAFAREVLGEEYGAASSNDHGTIDIDGESVEVEFAQFNFVNAYMMVMDVDGDGVVDNTENWAEKEQETHTIIISNGDGTNGTYTNGLGAVTIDDDNSQSKFFSGNDVSAIGINIGGVTYYGWVSRPLKIQGSVVGFYFWTDVNFGNMATAQADGNQDADADVSDNVGFILVVKQSYFDGLNTSQVIVPSTGVQAGSYTVTTVKSSSDRVDNALNALIVDIETAPDYLTIEEDTVGTGNVLTNDIITSGASSLTVASFQVAGDSTVYTQGQTATIPNVGTVIINSDGSYTFTPVDDYNGTVPTITYTVTDGNATVQANNLYIKVTPVLDPPVARDDTATAIEKYGVSNATIDANSDPSGNVITGGTADTDPESGTLTITRVENASTSSVVSVTSSHTNISSAYASIQGKYGELRILQDGSYQYLVNNDLTVVEELLPGDSLTDEEFTYTLESSVSGKTVTATITITIQGRNDTPIAENDYNVAKETTTTPTAITGFIAEGDVTLNDDDVDHLLDSNKFLVGMDDTGSAVAGNYSSTGSTTVLTFVTNSNISSAGSGTSVFVFWDPDTEANATSDYGILKDANGNDVYILRQSAGAVSGTTDITLSGTPATYWDTNTSQFVPFTDMESQLNGNFTFGTKLNNSNVEPANSTKDGVLQPNNTNTVVKIDISSYSGSIYKGMSVSALSGAAEVLPEGTIVTGVTYNSSGIVTGITLSNDFNPKPSDPTGYALSFSFPVGATVITTAYGTLDISVDGSYTYTPIVDNPLLSEGQSIIEAFDYTMKDSLNAESSATLYITVMGSGTNDPIAVAQGGTAIEAGGTLNDNPDPISGTNATGSLHSNVTTASDFATLFVSSISSESGNAAIRPASTSASALVVTGKYGTLTINKDGSYTYVVNQTNPAVQALRVASDTLTEDFEYIIESYNDANYTTRGGVDSETLTIIITGANDAPIGNNDDTTAFEVGVTLGSNGTGNVLTNDTDVDDTIRTVTAIRTGSVKGSGTAGTVDGSTILQGTYGKLIIAANGSYTYTVDDNNTTVNALAAGATLTDSFNYTVTDDTSNDGSATATDHSLTDIAVLNITIVGQNDRPVAEDNTYSATEDTDLTGKNIISDNDATAGLDSDPENDTLSISEINGQEFSTLTDSTHSSYTTDYKQLELTNGTVYLKSDGTMQYVPNSNAIGTDTFEYKVTDGTVSSAAPATVTITIADVNDPPTLVLESGANPVRVYESGMAAGTQSATYKEITENAFTVADIDGIADIQSITFTVGSTDYTVSIGDTLNSATINSLADMVGYSFNTSAGTFEIIGYDGGTLAYQYTLNTAQAHATGAASDETTSPLTETISLKTSDGTVSSASVDLVINIYDDAPVISASNIAAIDTLTVDETTLSNNATANFADNFSVSGSEAISYGADGAGSTAYTLVLTGTDVASGLYTLGANGAQGNQIVLNQSGNTITGSYTDATTSTTTNYFTISIDTSTGDVTLDQLAAIYHSDGTDGNDTSTLTTAANTLVLRATVTDADDDIVTHDLDVGASSAFNFNDDAPVITAGNVAAIDSLTVDETTLSTNATANFADNFSVSGSEAISYGADGAGSTAYTLVLTGTDVASGLYTLGANGAQGNQIVLNQSGNTITGSYTDATTSTTTNYFTISIDTSTGDVTLDQLAAIYHSDGTDGNDTSTLTTAANTLVLRATVTDSDDDIVTHDLDVGAGSAFNFKDDAPVITAGNVAAIDSLTVDETTLSTNATANFADNFSVSGSEAISYGADGAGSTAYTLVLTGTDVASGLYTLGANGAQGNQIVLNQSSNVITGSYGGTNYFTISIDNTTGAVTLDQLAAIYHSDDANGDDISTLLTAANTLVLRATVIDADNDSMTHDLDVGAGSAFNFKDDAPTAVNDTASTNMGGSAITGNVITDATTGDSGNDTALKISAVSQTGATLTVGSASTTANGGSLTLNADGSYSYTAPTSGVPAAGVTETFTYTLMDADGDTTTATLAISVTGPSTADLVTVKTLSSGDSTPNEGDTVTFLITVTNNGAAQATNVSLTDQMPSGITLTGNTPSQGTYNSTSGIWSIGTLNKGASVTLTLTGKVDVGQGGNTITNEATAASTLDQTDPSTAGDDLTESVVVNNDANLVTVKTLSSGDSTPSEGDTVTFLITVTNNGAAQATNVSLTDQMPLGITLTGNTPSQGNYNAASGIWSIGTLNSGASVTLSLTGNVDAGEGGNTITNIATAASTQDQNDPTTDGDDLIETVVVEISSADLSISKSVDDQTPDLNGNMVYTIVVNNAGNDTAENVRMIDELPAGLEFVSADSANYNATTGIWSVGNLAADASATLKITAKVVSVSAINNVAEVTSDTFDPNTDNNKDDGSSDPEGNNQEINVLDADLSVKKSVDDQTPDLNGNVVYTIVVNNAGNDTAENVRMIDELPAGLEFVSADSANYDATTGIWSVGDLAADASATLKITAKVVSVAAINNVAEVTSDTFDPDQDNNKDDGTSDPEGNNQEINVLDADLSVKKSVDDQTPDLNGNVVYTIVVNNAGNDTAENVRMIDELPAGLEFVSADSANYNATTGIWSVGDLAADASATLKITAKVVSVTAINNVAEVTSDTFDPNQDNNKDDGSTDSDGNNQLISPVIPSLEVNGPASPVGEGSDVIFEVSISEPMLEDQIIDFSITHITTSAGETGSITPYYFLNGTIVYLEPLAGGYIIPAGVTSLYVAVESINDANLEGLERFNLNATLRGMPEASDSDEGSVIDNGTGSILNLDGSIDPNGVADDDTPPVLPEPVIVQAAPAPAVIPAPAAGPAAPVEPIVIEPAPVEPPPPPAGELIVQRNIPLQEAKVDESGLTVIDFTIPADTFAHTGEQEYVLSAVLVDGAELPAWLIFNAEKGEFSGIAPEGFEGVVEIRVIARDDSGRQVETVVRIEVKANQSVQKVGKLHVLDQMQQDDHFAWKQARDKWIAQAKQLAADRLVG